MVLGNQRSKKFYIVSVYKSLEGHSIMNPFSILKIFMINFNLPWVFFHRSLLYYGCNMISNLSETVNYTSFVIWTYLLYWTFLLIYSFYLLNSLASILPYYFSYPRQGYKVDPHHICKYLRVIFHLANRQMLHIPYFYHIKYNFRNTTYKKLLYCFYVTEVGKNVRLLYIFYYVYPSLGLFVNQ